MLLEFKILGIIIIFHSVILWIVIGFTKIYQILNGTIDQKLLNRMIIAYIFCAIVLIPVFGSYIHQNWSY